MEAVPSLDATLASLILILVCIFLRHLLYSTLAAPAGTLLNSNITCITRVAMSSIFEPGRQLQVEDQESCSKLVCLSKKWVGFVVICIRGMRSFIYRSSVSWDIRPTQDQNDHLISMYAVPKFGTISRLSVDFRRFEEPNGHVSPHP
jgi:hypothetical protein